MKGGLVPRPWPLTTARVRARRVVEMLKFFFIRQSISLSIYILVQARPLTQFKIAQVKEFLRKFRRFASDSISLFSTTVFGLVHNV